MGPLKSPSIHISNDIATLIAGEWEFTGWWGSEPRPYAIRIGSGIDRQNPPDYPAEWQGDKGWVKVERSPADPPESADNTPPETTHDDLAERIAIAIAPTVIRYWADDQRDLPAEIAKLAKAIAGELRK
jgi:hypothetical protein